VRGRDEDADARRVYVGDVRHVNLDDAGVVKKRLLGR
jgi:hypothetical protein